MRPRIRSPFAGKPRTIELKDKNGNLTGYRIFASHIGPIRAQIADNAANIASLGLLGVGLYHLSTQPFVSDLELAAALLIPIAAWPIFKLTCRRALRTTKIIDIRKDILRINGLGWTNYERHRIRGYALTPHRRADKEKEVNQVRAQRLGQKGRFRVWPKYFQESWHVYLEYGRQPIRIMDVYGHEEAQRIQRRLMGCDEEMDKHGSPSGGPSSNPEDIWE